MKAFLICPVRGADPDAYESEVRALEADGWQVHWPPRDTHQDDPTGYAICRQNLEAIRQADRIFIIWDNKSQGSLFDAGMAFALEKPITVLVAPDLLGSKSFQDMLHEWESKGRLRYARG